MDPRLQDLKGRLKEAAGALTGNDKLKADGAADQAEAGVEDLAGDVASKAGELASQAGAYAASLKDAFVEGTREDPEPEKP